MDATGQMLLAILVYVLLHVVLLAVLLVPPIAPKDSESAVEKSRQLAKQRDARPLPPLNYPEGWTATPDKTTTSTPQAGSADRDADAADNIGASTHPRSSTQVSHAPEYGKPFTIAFDGGHTARAIRVNESTDSGHILRSLGVEPRPCIFISGGAGGMSDEDRNRVKAMIAEVARFAQQREAVIIDGGTEAGIMQMVGEARQSDQHDFPLIGVAPLGKVAYPGYENPGQEASLEDGHSHFVLVEGDEWGDETTLIVNLLRAIRDGGRLPGMVILINGGSIALKEVHLATTQELNLPTLVLEGSGRAADELSTAFRSGRTTRKILQAILEGGDIELVGVIDGPDALRTRLQQRFDKQEKPASDDSAPAT